jgi:hypothetical protein
MKPMSQKKKSSAPSTNLNQSIGVDSRLHLLRSLSRARTVVLLALVGAMAAVAYSTTSASSGGGLLGSSASASKPVGSKAVSPIKRIGMRTQNLFGQAPGEPILGLADLNIERRGHTATPLAGGRILIVGGENDGGLVKKSEVFDPDSRSFLIAARLRTSRKDHTATKLEDGRVLVAGGRNQGLIDSTEIFDSAKGEFVSGPPLNRARAGHSATTLKDGRILIAGGDDHGTAEIFDPETQTFTLLEGRLSASRAFHSALLLRNGKVLIAGGLAEDKSAIQYGEVFDPESMSFSVTRNSMRGARVRPTLRVLSDGKVQVIGGDPERSMEMFNAEGEYFTAYAHLLPGSKPISQILRAQTRAGLIHEAPPGDLKLQAALPAWLDELLDRSEHSLIDMPSSGEAVVAGGKSGGGKVLKSVVILSSSGATVTTDKTDYVPGETVIMTGSSWAVGETVQLTLHRDVGADDTILTAVADADRNFTNSEYVIQDSDFNVTFLLTAAGQTSGYTAQTTFTDAGPTNPTAQSVPYSQDFSGLSHSGAGSDIYPAGWQGWTLATGSSAAFRTSAPTADETLIAGSSASTTQGGVLNYNGKVGILATGSGGTDPSLCLAINTTGSSSVVVGFDIMTIRNPNTRINQVDLQYRVGTTGSFTSVSGNANGIYQNNSTLQTASGVTTPQNPEAKIFTLPSACDNQPNVQLRWVQRDVSGAGSRPSFAVDNLSVGVCPSVGAAGAITGPTSVCAGATGVTYSISAVGGATAYTWTVPSGASIASGQGTTSITLNWGSTSGDVTVTPSNSCATGSASSLAVTVSAAPVGGIASASDSPICSGSSATISLSGQTGSIVKWQSSTDGGATWSDIVSTANPLPTGALSVTTQFRDVVKSGSCPEANSSAATVTVDTVSFTTSKADVTCNGANNGAITVTTTGGTAPFMFSQDNGGSFQSSNVFSGLSAGTYNVVVKDANNCTAASQSVTITEPAALVLSEIHTNVSCNGGSNGSIDLGVSGGTPGYSYSWSPGAATSQDLSGLSAGTYTVTVTDANGCTAMKGVTITQPSLLTCSVTPASAVICAGGLQTFTANSSGGTPNYTYLWNTGATTQSITAGAAGSCSVTVTDANGCTTSCSATLVVTSAAVTVTPNTQQYSDKATFVATLSPVGILPAGSIVTFCVGTQNVGTATLAINGSVLKATLPDVPLLEPTPYGMAPTGQMAPGMHSVTAKFGAAAVPICDPATSLTITQEDARAYYTGAVFSSTACATCSTATVTLSATIKDITAEMSDPATDPCPGDIRNATVTFIDRDTNTAIISNLPVGLVSPGDAKIGTATYNWSVNIGAADSQNFTIGIIVNNYYTRDNSADDTVVTVSKPVNNFITGGGYLVMSSSSGLYPGAPGSKCNWGFNVKYNNSGKNLQGNMNVIIRNGGRVYQVKGSAMSSLSVNAATGKATFNGKANIQDITDPLNVTAIDGNATLQVVMTDKGEPGSQDTIGITVWNKQGGLWFSSHWNSTTTVEQLLGGGNLVVH